MSNKALSVTHKLFNPCYLWWLLLSTPIILLAPGARRGGGEGVGVAVKPHGMAAATCITHIAEAQKFQWSQFKQLICTPPCDNSILICTLSCTYYIIKHGFCY